MAEKHGRHLSLDSNATDNVHVLSIRPLLPPQILEEELPATAHAQSLVEETRGAIRAAISGESDKLVCIVGPCSIHDPEAALEYARGLQQLSTQHNAELVIVMRVYFEKPRTTIGWKGLVNDPDLDGSYKVNKGLRVARKLLLDIHDVGLPAAVEYLDTILPQYISDVVSWGAIGARTTESQIHRELASGTSSPVGFKNGTTGDVQVAIDSVKAANSAHHFLGVTKQGLASIVATSGNPHTHIILRGGSNGPNYSAEHIADAVSACAKAGVKPSVMIDCSHGNSHKKYAQQVAVCRDVADQVAGGNAHIIGVMIESNLKEGQQPLRSGQAQELVYGMSITDGCVSLATTAEMLDCLAEAVKKRRSLKSK